jgi:aryl-alcohol dehydrogenase-like predicted oxidoreductase
LIRRNTLRHVIAIARFPPRAQHGTTVANVSARWVLQQPQVPAVIIGARNASHVPDHQRLFSFELDSEDLSKIEGVLAETRQPTGDCYEWERGGRF